jgi:uracil-DNA glycosylase
MQTLSTFTFPFGETVKPVIQKDQTSKRIFVLGVYASAVHARWIDAQGRLRVSALAVASEPYIFWRGDDVVEILKHINIPPALGKLLPATPKLNGPSGIALDELFIHPLGLRRDDAWLCDLVPHSCLNPKQKAAIEREYQPLVEQYSLPKVTLPSVPRQLANDERRQEIVQELEASKANTLVLLGDEPVRWFLQWFDPRWKTLSDFGQNNGTYGQLHDVEISGKSYRVLPLVHPRQAAKLGTYSANWHNLHQYWLADVASAVSV